MEIQITCCGKQMCLVEDPEEEAFAWCSECGRIEGTWVFNKEALDIEKDFAEWLIKGNWHFPKSST